MTAPCPLYHTITSHLDAVLNPQQVPRPSRTRLALLILGLVAAQSTVLARIARELHALAVTHATTVESVARRLRRTLNDPLLLAEECYSPVLASLIPWPRRPGAHLVLAIDESSQDARCHLFRVSLPYWGNAIPLVWTLWPQNVALPAGSDWAMLHEVLDRLAALLPSGVAVWIVADRGYAAPELLDQCTERGWHWLVRLPLGSHRFRDARGREGEVRTLLRRYVTRPGQRWKASGWLFKGAGWRAVSVVACWEEGEDEPLVVVTDAPARWSVLARYARRFWIEPGFRNDKSHGWEWEASQVEGLTHQAVLLVAMAWASVLAVCLGVREARGQCERHAGRGRRVPEHARMSVFTYGLLVTRAWL